ncbi:hypothetical protein [Kitasatospora sp. NPDC088548]|uniref:hypothetical protein n=1 Tax=Kitasatospora sp. NPDC088548 TaxID=3364075 RepID=UPI003828631E
MIPSNWRCKGGALLIGAAVHGQPGPFGTWADDDDQEPDESATTEADEAGLCC